VEAPQVPVSAPAIAGQRIDAVARGALGVPGAVHLAPEAAARAAPGPIDVDAIVEQVQRRLLRQISVEGERRGVRR
jgi:hypothetical protein